MNAPFGVTKSGPSENVHSRPLLFGLMRKLANKKRYSLGLSSNPTSSFGPSCSNFVTNVKENCQRTVQNSSAPRKRQVALIGVASDLFSDRRPPKTRSRPPGSVISVGLDYERSAVAEHLTDKASEFRFSTLTCVQTAL